MGLPPPLSYEHRPFDLTVADGEPSPVGWTIRDALLGQRTGPSEIVAERPAHTRRRQAG